MDYLLKQATLNQLAQARLAVNYVLRNRYMDKQAIGPIGGTVKQRPIPSGKTPTTGYNVKFQGPKGFGGYSSSSRKRQKEFRFTGPTSSTGQGFYTKQKGYNLNESGQETLNQGTPQSPSWNEPTKPED